MCELGITEGCTACEEYSKSKPHNLKCRERFRKLLQVNDDVPETKENQAANFLESSHTKGETAIEGDTTALFEDIDEEGKDSISPRVEYEPEVETSGAVASGREFSEKETPTPKTTAHTTVNQQEKKPSEKPNVGIEIPPYLPSQDLMLGAPRKPRIGKSLAFDMEEYCISAVKLYQDLTGHTTLKEVKAPFCLEGSLPEADEETQGELSGNACSILMKDLWLARLSRPDI